MVTVMRRELSRYGWVLAAVPLAGAVVSSASFAFFMWIADEVLALDALNVDEETWL